MYISFSYTYAVSETAPWQRLDIVDCDQFLDNIQYINI